MTDRRDNTPPPADWQPTPKPWSEAMCCPAECPKVCETPPQAVWMHGTELALAEVDALGCE